MTALRNPGFELGATGWAAGTGWSIVNDAANARSGSWCAKFSGSSAGNIWSTTEFYARPGGKVSYGGWFRSGSSASGTGIAELQVLDASGAVVATDVSANSIAAGSSTYAESRATNAVLPARAKRVRIIGRITAGSSVAWYADDFWISGDLIEPPPALAIVGGRMTGAEIVGVFDPLIGSRAYSSVNAGMSDRWRGVWQFEPVRGVDLSALRAWLARVGRTGLFLAHDPLYTGPSGGAVSGMVVDGAGQTGTTLAVRGGPASTTPLLAGEYIEVGAQLFVLREDLELDASGKGVAHIWPAIRTSPADGEDVVTEAPACVARITEAPDIRSEATGLVRLAVSWEEVV